MEGAVGKEEQETLIETFVGIASSTREEAIFFLESHNWQLDSSIHSFFEHQQPPPPHPIIAEQPHQEEEEEEEEELPLPAVLQRRPAAMASREEGKKKKEEAKSGASGRRSKIRTLSDLKSGPGSDSDSDGPQEYYTGGEKSGMLVQGPSRDPSRGVHDVDSIFDQARQMGAMQGPFEQQPLSSSRNFTGTGRLLSGETVPAAPQQPENVVHNIYFWSNGFTINDGPLRRFDDPENAPFLESIRKSECPKELEPEDRRTAVHVNLIRREEDCPEPVKRLNPFQGVGRTLGGSGSPSDSPGPEPAVAAASATIASTAGALVVDDSLPTTSIQLRLADGTRRVARFNTHHTVGDIRVFIDNHTSSGHGAAARAYTLQTVGFPPKQLTDVTQSIEQAGLANSVVIQKL
ncbi:plant UBX domain-containing protein 4-like [Iris pallida]|uniref:Plant UBX domain-containing protein 4-like n=1 Tax=Iris pallida TaxID=29817 RepID=A0AAX6IBP1_IRIPA|nr:plant UBX domain-containing protein 4-like [Iris pallida]